MTLSFYGRRSNRVAWNIYLNQYRKTAQKRHNLCEWLIIICIKIVIVILSNGLFIAWKRENYIRYMTSSDSLKWLPVKVFEMDALKILTIIAHKYFMEENWCSSIKKKHVNYQCSNKDTQSTIRRSVSRSIDLIRIQFLWNIINLVEIKLMNEDYVIQWQQQHFYLISLFICFNACWVCVERQHLL